MRDPEHDGLPLPAGVRRAFRLAVRRRGRTQAAQAAHAARDVDDEIAFHLAMREQQLRAAGLSAADARTMARARFGDVPSIAAACVAEDTARERTGVRTERAAALWQDARVAVRALRRAPLTTAAALLTLALGIGATTATFGVVYDVLLRPLPFDRPDRLVFLWAHAPGRGDERLPLAAPDVAVIASQARELSAVAFTNRVSDATWMHDGQADRLRVAAVTSNFFATLGARPALGRTFRPGEGLLPAPPNVAPIAAPNVAPAAPPPDDGLVLSDALWRTRFGADPGILGRRLTLGAQTAVVVGVMPPGFAVPFPPGSGFAAAVDAWMPVRQDLSGVRRQDGALIDQDTDNAGAVIARLRPSATLASVDRELARLADVMDRASVGRRGAESDGARVVAAPLASDGVRHVRPALVALLAAGVLLYLVACLNVGSVLVSRVLARATEFGVRSALGAGRSRLVRQVLAEVAVLAGLGAAGGVALALAATRVAFHMRPASLPRLDDAGLAPPASGATFGVSLGAAALAVLLVGLAAAGRAAALGEAHALGSRGGVRGDALRDPWRRALTTAQVALAVMLAVGCGLLMRSASRLAALDPGFRAEGAVAFDLSLRGTPRYDRSGAGDRTVLLTALEERLRGTPGVVAVGVVSRVPLGERRWTNTFGLDGAPPATWGANAADFRMVSPDYFRAIGTRVVRGRAFTADENRVEQHRVVIVDEVLARRIAPDGRALGRRLAFPLDGKPVSAEVVGVVDAVRFASLWEAPRGAFYVPYRHEASRDLSIVVRTTGDPATLLASVPRLVRDFDRQLPVYNLRPMAAYVGDSVATMRFALLVLTGFAGTAIALALFGVFATLSHGVAQRRREIGVRLALGATAGRVVGDVLRSGGAVVATGTGIGLGLALVAGRGLRALLFEVRPTDPLVLGAVAAVVALTGLAAAALPARRAARTDPMASLRSD